MKTRTQTRFGTRLAAMLMLALVLFSAVGFSHGVAGGSASFAPVSVAWAVEEDGTTSQIVVDEVFNIVNDQGSIVAGNVKDNWKPASMVAKSKGIAQIILGICTVIAIVSLVMNVAKMAAASTNEANRKKAQTGILWSGVALALFGGLSLIVGFFWSFLTGI